MAHRSNIGRWGCSILVFSLLVSGGSAYAAGGLSPPNPEENCPWDEVADQPGEQQTFLGVVSIERAFNNARRWEEDHFGLPAGTLGTLDMPDQATWDAMTDDAKALFIINDERMDRAGMFPQIIGLPLRGVESHIDAIAAHYGDLLYENNWTGHNHDGSPFDRIDREPDIGNRSSGGNCHEFLPRAENLAYFEAASSELAPPIPLPLERAIYNWIYNDLDSEWGHREAVLLQERSLENPPGSPDDGYKNNRGEVESEGYLGVYVRTGIEYDPFGYGENCFGPSIPCLHTGSIVVMNIFDPVADGAENECHYNPVVDRTEAEASLGLANRAITVIPNDQWVQLSIAGEPNSTENTVAAIIGDDIPGLYSQDWIMYSFNPAGNVYHVLNLNDPLRPGEAYWLLQRTGTEALVDMPGSASDAYAAYCETTDCLQMLPCTSAKGCMAIQLVTTAGQDQWQMIGNSIRATVPLNAMRVVTDTGACVGGCTLDQAAANSIVQSRFWRYNGTNYQALDTATGTVDNWAGFWVMTMAGADGLNPRLAIPVP